MDKQEIIEDILTGLPEALPSDSASYANSGGVSLGETRPEAVPMSVTDRDNIMALLNTASERLAAGEELHRRSIRALGDMEIRLKQLENKLGTAKGIRI